MAPGSHAEKYMELMYAYIGCDSLRDLIWFTLGQITIASKRLPREFQNFRLKVFETSPRLHSETELNL